MSLDYKKFKIEYSSISDSSNKIEYLRLRREWFDLDLSLQTAMLNFNFYGDLEKQARQYDNRESVRNYRHKRKSAQDDVKFLTGKIEKLQRKMQAILNLS